MSSKCPIVLTTQGKCVGRVCAKPKLSRAEQVYNYAGIPFAKPPVDDLRFEPPVKPDPWIGLFEATKNAASAMQDLQVWQGMARAVPYVDEFDDDFELISEDCLYVNIFTPSPDAAANLPVMVWFHGGAFAMGSPMHYNGQVLASLNDVVVVMPAYRVNVFGFLSLGRDTKWSGNMGMLDQVMALEWTRDNIKSFGGDPSNVTIFGESAGGASVGLHMVSPLSRGLFHRSISQSGIASMADDAVCESPHLALCEQLKIAEKDPAEMMNMLKKVSATAIMIAQEEILKLGKYFIPVVDGKFLPRSATEMMNSRQLAPVPYMIGFNSTEANGLLSMKIPGFTDGLKASDVEQGIKGWMMMTTAVAAENQEKAAEVILQEYTQHYEDDDKFKWSKLQGEFTADTLLVLKSMDTADANQATGNPTYVYRMSHRLRLHHEAELGRGMDMKPDFCECDHGDDLYFTFGLPLTGAKLAQDVCFSAQEQKMSEIWMRYLTNFARHGNPNEGESVPVEWPLYCKASRPYLDARMPFTSGEGLLIDKTRFWRENIYKL